ncbi:serine/threonine-protein kinase 31 isoform X2 [Pseudophryne corroboree]|uniref:serine/threonine-protein kinase 31 isoform X2 n=1 Tax=Pseudophryne corroboree TaxID=495146 RepID=UPI0030812CFB
MQRPDLCIISMEGESGYNKVEDVFVSHVEDAVTFWGQSMNRIHDISKLTESLARVCPTMNTVFGTPDLEKVYGGMFSADKCWYRCKLQHVLSDEKCAVTYIDYGNSEILNRSSIVDLPDDLQIPAVAQKYRLWGLQLQTAVDIEQGLKFLSKLIGDKQIAVQHKAVYKDGTFVVHAVHGDLDIGEEVAQKGFAERCKLSSPPNGPRETMEASANNGKSHFLWANRNIERPPMREPKSIPMFNRLNNDLKVSDSMKGDGNTNFQVRRLCSTDTNGVKRDQRLLLDEIKQLKDENKQLKDENKQLKDENKQLKDEKEIMLQKSRALELRIQKMQNDIQSEKANFEQTINEMEKSLKMAIGNKFKDLTNKMDILKVVRCENENLTIADDLLEAARVVNEEQVSAPCSLNILEENWTEYKYSQEMIQACSDVVELDMLIDKRNKVQQELTSSVDAFIVEVNQMPLDAHFTKLQMLLQSLMSVYGASSDCDDSDDVFQEFYKWKQAKLEKFNSVRNDTTSSLEHLTTWFSDIKELFGLTSNSSEDSSDVVENIDNILEKFDSDISKELQVSLLEQSEDDKKIIINAYNGVVKRIHEQTHLISTIKSKYLSSVEFKKNIVQWINTNPNVDDLMEIKKTIKGLKAQLRWKLLESSTMEESDEYSETALSELKHDIATIRDKIFYEIQREQEEYTSLSVLVQKWFPELPLMYCDAGIIKYMNSGGLLSGSMERELFDAESLKELSSKRPLVCAQVQNKKVLLKSYSVDMDAEEQVIVRAEKYHKAWLQEKEESGIMQLLYLFFCKSDPMVYLMVPFYSGESLSHIQANDQLNSYETLKVMSGVAQGLHTLHAAGITVGSLHYNNVFAVNRMRGIVGDLDFTRDAEQRSSATSICFPLLTAPELKLGQPASKSSDVYAYGMILLWLCVGNKNIVCKQDGTPDLSKNDMDTKAKDLLSRLVCCGHRMPAELIKAHEYFQIAADVPTVSPEKSEEIAENTPADCS